MSAIDKDFDRLFLELRDLRIEMRAEFAAVRQNLAATQRQMTRTVAGFATGLQGVLSAAVLTQLRPRRAALAVDQPAVRRAGGLHDRFRERRVRVDRPGDL